MYQVKREIAKRMVYAVLLVTWALLCGPVLTNAQSVDVLPIARTISIADPEVAYGDIILYDVETNLYRRSQDVNDPRVYGVVVEDPTLLIETDATLVPVAENGLVLINVTLENGDIEVGDAIVTSSVPGKGMHANPDQVNSIGFAVERFTEADGVVSTLEDGSTAILGTIKVEMGGKRLQAASEGGTDDESDSASLALNSGKTIARFGFAAIVALGSIALTFIAFLSSIKQGVISVGRNPLAKSSIRSMIILNVILALIVTTIGVFFAISLLIVPL